jgi:hypothetical protein
VPSKEAYEVRRAADNQAMSKVEMVNARQRGAGTGIEITNTSTNRSNAVACLRRWTGRPEYRARRLWDCVAEREYVVGMWRKTRGLCKRVEVKATLAPGSPLLTIANAALAWVCWRIAMLFMLQK